MEDYPRNQAEFEARFSKETVCQLGTRVAARHDARRRLRHRIGDLGGVVAVFSRDCELGNLRKSWFDSDLG